MIIFIILILMALYFFFTGQFFFSFLLFTLALLSLVTETKPEHKTVIREKDDFKPSEGGGEKVVAENLAGFINFIMHFVGRVVSAVFKPVEGAKKDKEIKFNDAVVKEKK
jgi:Na+-transporting methylmalonyl-CoA/oxaloacetate decarboxylase gamma subunit